MTLTATVRATLTAFDAHRLARVARADSWVDKHSDYRAVSEAERETFRQLSLAMDSLKAALAADDVRRAAEDGSPAARLFEPNGGKR